MISKKLVCGVLAVLCAGGIVSANAEDNVYELSPVIVTATNTPVDSNMKVNAAVNVISRKDIEQKHYKNMVEVLNDVPGVQTMTPANGIGFEVSGYAQPTMRGINRIVYMVDGVRQDFGGRSYSANMARNMQDVERVEVMKGTASGLYGAEAVGGVVNVITRSHYDKPEGKLTAAFGNFKTRNFQIDYAGESGKSFWSFSALTNHQGNYKDGHGRSLFQDADISELDLKYGYHLSDTDELIFKYTNHYQNQDYVEGRGNGWVDPTFGTLRYETATAIWKKQAKDNKWGNTMSFYRGEINSNRYEDAIYSGSKKMYGNWSEKFKHVSYVFQDNYYNQIDQYNRISAGVEYVKRDLQTLKSKYNTASSKATERDAGIYLQDEWNITDKLKLVAGERYAWINVGKHKFIPSFDLGYTFNDNAMMYVSSKGFMYYPSIINYAGNETSNRITIQNHSLKPLTGTTNEVGAKFKINKDTYFDIAYFDRKQKDTLDYNVLGEKNGKTVRQYYNYENPIHIRGIELNLRKHFGDYFDASLFYSHLDTAKEITISNMPKNTYGINLTYTRERFDIGLSGLGRHDIQRSSSLIKKNYKLPYSSFWVWNLYGNYKVTDNVKVWAKVNNLFDKMYEYTPDFDSKWNMPREYICPGRSFVIGVEYKF